MTTRGFSLRPSLVEKAKQKAKAQNLSFSAYVRKLVGEDAASKCRKHFDQQAVNFATATAEAPAQEVEA